MSGTYCLWPTRTSLGPDVLLGASSPRSNRRKSPKVQTSMLAQFANIVKRLRPSLRKFVKMSSTFSTSPSSQRRSPASQRSFTTRCTSFHRVSTLEIVIADYFRLIGKVTTTDILQSLLLARSARLPRLLPTRLTRYVIVPRSRLA